MSTERPVDPQAVEETKQQIRGLVGEIASLTRQELEPAVFYGEFLQRVITALAAIGGAVWVLKGNELRLTYQINLRQAFPEDSGDDQARHARLLHRVIQNDEHLLVPPYSGTAGDEEAGNPTSYLLVLAPVRDDERVAGVVEIFQRPTSGPASQRGYLRFLVEMCQHVNDFLRARRFRQLTDWHSLFTEVDRFSRAVHEGLDPKVTAYTIANEGRRLIACDRVSVALQKGRKCVIEAVSGQDTMDMRSNAVVLLGRLATAVVRTGEPLWYTGSSEDLPPQIEEAVHNYVDETHTKTVAVIPLRRPPGDIPDGDESKWGRDKDEGRVIGALIVEQIEDSRSPAEFAQSVDLVCDHSARALANSVEHNTLFLMPLWRAIGRAKWVVQARTLPKTLAVLAVVLLAIAGLVLYPWDFEMEGKGELQPKERRNVFVDVDGEVTEVLVEHGDMVKKGQVLVKLTNNDLAERLEVTEGELLTAQKSLAAVNFQRSNLSAQDPVERVRQDAEALRLKTRIEGLEKQRDLLKKQLALLTIVSPVNGQVLTWHVEENLLHRPVTRGNLLLTIADTSSEWSLEIFMEEDRIGHIERALPKDNSPMKVTYILKTDPRNQLEGTLTRNNIHDAAQLHEEHGHSVRLIVDVNEDDLVDPRPGTEVAAKVYCGKKPVGYVWFHELVEFLQRNLFF
jgi:hypothetical protein